MDDIVIRLRQMQNMQPMREGNIVNPGDAADEIERLREIAEHLSAQLRLQLKANDKAWEAYKEVVGDD